MTAETALTDENGESSTNGGVQGDGPESATPVSASTSTIPIDTIFGLLSVERRRRVLAYLDEQERTVTIGELAEYIAARENDVEESQLSSSQRKRVYVALYQCHLPKLADADVVSFDSDRGTIELGPNVRLLFPYLELARSDGHERPADGKSAHESGLAGFVSRIVQCLSNTESGRTRGEQPDSR